jgi:hypothetical protein
VIEPTVQLATTYETARRAYFVAQDHTAVGLTVAEHHRAACLAGLAAVFDLVERDYDVRCGARCPPERGYGAIRCTRPATKHPEHTWIDGDAMVVWP